MPFTGPDLCAATACDIVDSLRAGTVSSAELVEAALARIGAVEPAVNAVVTPCPDRARAAAAAWDGGDPEDPGWLGGLPIGVKDLTPVAGVRTTYGTAGYADHVPTETDPLIARLERRGGIVVGKTNTPELGAGANTFNAVFGRTRNPWNTTRNAAGSSGGAAVSLATGETWLSHGSDHGGSLRTPAAYCRVVGLRPSPGVAGGGAPDLSFQREGAQGPMARTVADCALFLDAMAGFDPVWPFSHPAPPTPYRDATRAPRPPRIAFAPDLGGFAPVEPAVGEVLASAMAAVADAGARVEETCPDLAGLDTTYQTLRGLSFGAGPGRAPADIQAHFKQTIVDNIALGRALTIEQVFDAQRTRATLYHTMRAFLADHDVLACPVVGCLPGPVEEEYPQTVAGHPMADYTTWLRFAYLATVTGLPAMSVPAGFAANGMPVGIQLIGPPRGEATLLAAGQYLETVLGLDLSPIDPITP